MNTQVQWYWTLIAMLAAWPLGLLVYMAWDPERIFWRRK